MLFLDRDYCNDIFRPFTNRNHKRNTTMRIPQQIRWAVAALTLSVLGTISASAKEPKLPPLKPLLDYPVRDTSVCLGVDGMYYMTGTTGHPTWWKTNEGIRVWKSADLKTWKPLGLVWKIDQGTWQNVKHGDDRALWAPELHYIKGTYWLTYCMNFSGTGGTGLLKSTSGKVEGPYVDVHPKGPMTDEIDASLFADDDGKVYFVFQNGKIARLNDEMTELAEKPRVLKPSNAEQVGFEGAFITKVNGRYVLVCAEFNDRLGTKTYDCMSASSKNIYGPYGPRYLAIPHGGHNMLFKDKEGNWWSTFFGSDPKAPFTERPAILPIEFDDEAHFQPKLP
jgi:xylan 1,4-beta-xylosidase